MHIVLARPIDDLNLRLEQLIAHQEAALAALEAFLDRPRRASECFEALFGRRIGGAAYGLALAEAVGHLNHLHRTGAAVRWRDSGGAWLWQRREKAPDSAPGSG